MNIRHVAPADIEVLNDPLSCRDAALSLLAGELLGQGCFRRVYSVKYNPKIVLKLEIAGSEFCNVEEMGVWKEVCWTKWAEWFAPCHAIDRFGIALIQERTKPLTTWPKDFKIPSFFTDTKPENFGRIGNKIVCHDYGSNLFISRGLANVKMKDPA